ncbi:hypothetical protein HFQ13_10385 [Acidithiobacillus sp. VAN18-1]|uniref:Uncharacterized protein n=1 Tax=Igneacidithiobacillus copahuensis TaxID=2724909 RepID=A0AAE2YQP6_9PROT|nr:hypothetical protein [Igneacidithiobacillus copahuensis]MBU2796719.1 hypothetical protein [Acidithiobacillus sp. VAN18-2]
MLLTRDMIREKLGGCSWPTALRRLRALGIEPKRAGREAYITDDQLESAINGGDRQKHQEVTGPNWSALEQASTSAGKRPHSDKLRV